jgi:hypothetical protein
MKRALLKKLLDAVLQELDGIDKTESEDENGWWETSTGADFGVEKLQEIRNLFDEFEEDSE